MSLSCEVVVDETFLNDVKIMWRLDRELIISSGNIIIITLALPVTLSAVEVSQEVLSNSSYMVHPYEGEMDVSMLHIHHNSPLKTLKHQLTS